MTDINELRRLALDGDLAAMQEIIHRLEAAEKERDELLASIDEWFNKTKWVQQGVNEGTISAKYIGLHRADVMASLLGKTEKERDELRAALQHETDCLEAAKAKIDALRSKIEQIERQEPVGKFIRHPSNGLWEQDGYGDNPDARPLYALPGAQGND